LFGSTFSLEMDLTGPELRRLSRLPQLERVHIEPHPTQPAAPGLGASLPDAPAPELDATVDGVLKMTHLEELHVRCVDGPKKALEAMSGPSRIPAVTLQGTSLQGNDLAPLLAFPKIRTLELFYCQLGPGTLASLKQVECLQSLSLGGSRYVGSGLRNPQNPGILQPIGPRAASNAADADLEHLLELRSLSSLDLCLTQVTDVGLGHLERMVQLRALRLESVVGITAPGIEKLQQALPQCEIKRDQRQLAR
jgi:hypothetical protein